MATATSAIAAAAADIWGTCSTTCPISPSTTATAWTGWRSSSCRAPPDPALTQPAGCVSAGSGGARHELERQPVHAVAVVDGLIGHVVEQVPQMSAAAAAMALVAVAIGVGHGR